MTRRRVVASGVTVLGVGTAAALFSQESEAATVAFNVPDTNVERTEAVNDVRLNVTASVTWDANQAPEGYELRLLVGKNFTDLDMLTYKLVTEGVTAQGSEDIRLSGSLATTDHFTAEDFALPESGETTQTVAARLVFGLRNGGERVVTETAETTMQLTIRNGTVTAEIGLDATGEVVVD